MFTELLLFLLWILVLKKIQYSTRKKLVIKRSIIVENSFVCFQYGSYIAQLTLNWIRSSDLVFIFQSSHYLLLIKRCCYPSHLKQGKTTTWILKWTLTNFCWNIFTKLSCLWFLWSYNAINLSLTTSLRLDVWKDIPDFNLEWLLRAPYRQFKGGGGGNVNNTPPYISLK